MRLTLLAAGILATACSSPEPRVVHDTVFVHDTVRLDAKQGQSSKTLPIRQPGQTAASESSVFTRCLAAARLQGRASDERTGAPSELQIEARDANFQSLCKSMPGIYLPELR
jgi:hypothetical protein